MTATLIKNARKITAARIVGACAGAGAALAYTKSYATVCPVLALTIVSAAAIHRTAASAAKALEENGDEMPIEEVTLSNLAFTAVASAAEVGLVSVITSKLIDYGKNRLWGNKEAAPVIETAPVTPTV